MSVHCVRLIDVADSGTNDKHGHRAFVLFSLRPAQLITCFVDVLVRDASGSLLGQFGVVLEGLGFGQEGDGLGDLRVPLG